MNFDGDERQDPTRSWSGKESMDGDFANEVLSFTTDSIEETHASYNPLTDSIRNETRVGVCTACGRTLTRENAVQCHHGDQICDACPKEFQERKLCRRHFETTVGSKDDAFVFVGIYARMGRKEFRELTGFTELETDRAKMRLSIYGYVKFGGFGLLSKSPKITRLGRDALLSMVKVYRKDTDFLTFLKRIGWE